MRVNRIYTRSCEDMHELKDNSVALTVTSPPYWNAIDYDIHALDKRQHYRTRKYAQGYADYEDYLDWLKRVFQEVLRVTKPGGFCARHLRIACNSTPVFGSVHQRRPIVPPRLGPMAQPNPSSPVPRLARRPKN